MNDRLKFRSWDGKEFRYWGWNDDDKSFIGPPNFSKYPSYQCTGLKDKNGKLIFEGDIALVGNDGNPGVIKFGNYCIGKDDWGVEHRTPCFAVSYGNNPDNCFMMCSSLGVDIIGNIFDNPELVREEGE